MATENGTNGKAATPAPAEKEGHLAMMKRTVVDKMEQAVHRYLSEGSLQLPEDYSVHNAMKSAWLMLQSTVDREKRKALDVCTPISIANALLDMAVQGLNVSKKQAYFIVYGKELTLQKSYFGNMVLAKRVQPRIDDFAAMCVYEGDVFKYSIFNGKKTVVQHEQTIENVKKENIVAAYCIALDKDGIPIKTEIMTIAEIKQAWKQSPMNPVDAEGNIKDNSTQGKFTSEMALKTVTNRLCKPIIDASSDGELLKVALKRSEDLADRAVAEDEIEQLENTGPIIEIPSNAAAATSAEGQEEPEKAPEPESAAECPLKQQQRAPGW